MHPSPSWCYTSDPWKVFTGRMLQNSAQEQMTCLRGSRFDTDDLDGKSHRAGWEGRYCQRFRRRRHQHQATGVRVGSRPPRFYSLPLYRNQRRVQHSCAMITGTASRGTTATASMRATNATTATACPSMRLMGECGSAHWRECVTERVRCCTLYPGPGCQRNCVDNLALNLAQSLTRVVSTGETCTYHVISVSHRRHSARVWVMARIRVPGR
jgi:hypothetical protein